MSEPDENDKIQVPVVKEINNPRDTLTPTDFRRQKSGFKLQKSMSHESKRDNKIARDKSGSQARETNESKNIDLDQFNDDVSGIRLGALFKPYKESRVSSSNNFISKSPTNNRASRD